MRKALAVTFLALSFAGLLFPSFSVLDAYAHGISTCMTPAGGCALEKNNEQYSTTVLNMNDPSHGVLQITGTLRSKYYHTELRVVPYVSIGPYESNPFGSSDLNNLLRLFYPVYNDPVSWYFRVESNLTNPIVIKPGEELNYEIKVYPLKAGTYHVHSTFVYDYLSEGRYRFYQSTGYGQSVTVAGPSTPTVGEIAQLIIPFSIGAILLPLTILKIRAAAGQESPPSGGNSRSKLRLGIRLYFAVKASLESVWLAGLLSWFVLVAYPAFHSIETRVIFMAGMIVIVAAIAAGGYIAAFARSIRVQTIFAIGTAVASILVYFLLDVVSFYLFYNAGGIPFAYNLLPTSGVGYNDNQFQFYGSVPLIAFLANCAAALLSAYSVRRENRLVSKILIGGVSAVVLLAVLYFGG
jgi:hypothetical protein